MAKEASTGVISSNREPKISLLRSSPFAPRTYRLFSQHRKTSRQRLEDAQGNGSRKHPPPRSPLSPALAIAEAEIFSISQRELLKSSPTWTHLGAVLYWLHSDGTKIKCRRSKTGECTYVIGDRILSRPQILAEANRRRAARGLSLFLVEALTEN